MRKIICIEKEHDIYKKGRIVFDVIESRVNWRALMLDERGDDRLCIERKEYEDVWVPILKEHFPKLIPETWYWEPSAGNMGHVVIYEMKDETTTTMNSFLSKLSDSPEEIPATFRDMNARDFKAKLIMFRPEIPEGSDLMKKFDSLFLN